MESASYLNVSVSIFVVALLADLLSSINSFIICIDYNDY